MNEANAGSHSNRVTVTLYTPGTQEARSSTLVVPPCPTDALRSGKAALPLIARLPIREFSL